MTLPIRVLIVDDHEMVRTGVRTVLEREADLVVVGEARRMREAVAAATDLRPDVIVMDINLADGSGIEATREIKDHLPGTQVLMLTGFADDEALFGSIFAGASGYVLKDIIGNELVRAVRTVATGASLLDPDMTALVLERIRRGEKLFQDERLSRLTERETDVLELIASGRTNGEIATELAVAEKTVKNYVSSILTKLEVSRRAEAAAYVSRRRNPHLGDSR